MGKKRRLNRLISRWIKSDLPEEDSGSTVLLLGVTRIPSSPTPRRPRSLALQPTHHLTNSNSHTPNVLLTQRPVSVVHPYNVTVASSCSADNKVKSEVARLKCRATSSILSSPSSADSDSSAAAVDLTPTNNHVLVLKDSTINQKVVGGSPSPSVNMERSVDSIGTCSLDVDASAELLSDRCENPSVDTLRSNTSIKSLSPQQEHRLPSYLSLACTVNGYSQITNYDPVRLAKSRDSSPHRPLVDHEQLTYSIQNNLLSPPNLVPLPLTTQNYSQSTMSERTSTITSHRHEEFYSKKLFTTRKYTSYISDSVDRVDACIEKKFNGHHEIAHEKVELNGHTNGHTNGTTKIETKSFIQQRVERLYGPGALAQGFFVMKRQKSRLSESDAQVENGTNLDVSTDKHSKSMSDKLLLDDGDNTMKQSASSPSLPVLRHLTPEFRAQLPTFSPRRGVDTIQKSTTLPQLKDVNKIKPEIIINGKKHHNSMNMNNNVNGTTVANDCIADNLAINKLEVKDSAIVPEEDVKDGHYFLKILERETARLLSMADRAEEELDAGEGKLSENAKGFLRSASGKARLLVSQKMQQFKGLCTNNLTQADGEAFPTTNQDLQGFWDMVMLQVDQIDSIFKELDVLRANNWQEVEKERSEENKVNKPKTRISAPSARLRSAGAEEARAKRELERKQMLEQRRRAMREAKNSSEKSIEIFVPESS